MITLSVSNVKRHPQDTGKINPMAHKYPDFKNMGMKERANGLASRSIPLGAAAAAGRARLLPDYGPFLANRAGFRAAGG